MNFESALPCLKSTLKCHACSFCLPATVRLGLLASVMVSLPFLMMPRSSSAFTSLATAFKGAPERFATASFDLRLPRFRVFFFHVRLQHRRSAFHQVFRFLETERQDLLHHLDDRYFLLPYRGEFHVELTLLVGRRRRRSCDRDRLRRDAEFLFEHLHELIELEDGHLLDLLDEFLEFCRYFDGCFCRRCLCYCCIFR